MTATDAQVRIVMREREKGRTQEQAAATANLRSRKTAARYEQLGQLPVNEIRAPQPWQHRCSPHTSPGVTGWTQNQVPVLLAVIPRGQRRPTMV